MAQTHQREREPDSRGADPSVEQNARHVVLVGQKFGEPAGPVSASALRYDGVCKARGDRAALDAVSLTVDQGETFVIAGPQGAGNPACCASPPACRSSQAVASRYPLATHAARTRAQAPVLTRVSSSWPRPRAGGRLHH